MSSAAKPHDTACLHVEASRACKLGTRDACAKFLKNVTKSVGLSSGFVKIRELRTLRLTSPVKYNGRGKAEKNKGRYFKWSLEFNSPISNRRSFAHLHN